MKNQSVQITPLENICLGVLNKGFARKRCLLARYSMSIC